MATQKRSSYRTAGVEDELNMLTWLSRKLRMDRATMMLHLEEKHRTLLSEMQQTFGLSPAEQSRDSISSKPRTSTSLPIPSEAAKPQVQQGQTQAEDGSRHSFLLLPNSTTATHQSDPLAALGPRKNSSIASNCSVASRRSNLALPPSAASPQAHHQEQTRVSSTSIVLPSSSDAGTDVSVPATTLDSLSNSMRSSNRSNRSKRSNVFPTQQEDDQEGDESYWPSFEEETRNRANAITSVRVLSHLQSYMERSQTRIVESWWWRQYLRFVKIVKGQTFEIFFASMILLNATLMMFDLQREGLQIGYELEFPTYTRKSEVIWPGSKKVFDKSEKFFAVIFTVELVLRIAAYRFSCINSIWNWIDSAVVLLIFIPWIWEANFNMNPTIVRLARFGKLMKIVRLMRTTSFMASLKLLVTSIQASLNTLFWSLCVLMVIQIFFGMLISYFLLDFMNDPTKDDIIRRQVFAYFGTFWRSMVTMFEIIFANWGPICRLLLDDVNEFTGLFFVVYRCVIGFAILAVIQAVFIQQTMKTAAHDDQLCLEEKNREKAKFVERLHRVFNEMDVNGDGVISWDEFEPMMSDERLQGLMHTLEVSASDVHGLFQELDDGDGEISTEEFLKGISSLRGSAKAMDLVKVMNISRRLEAKLDCFAAHVSDGSCEDYARTWKASRSRTRLSAANSRIHKSMISDCSHWNSAESYSLR